MNWVVGVLHGPGMIDYGARLWSAPSPGGVPRWAWWCSKPLTCALWPAWLVVHLAVAVARRRATRGRKDHQ